MAETSTNIPDSTTPVYQFDPDASPDEKARQIDQEKPKEVPDREALRRAAKVDVQSSLDGQTEKPASGAELDGKHDNMAPSDLAMPAAFPTGGNKEIPEWLERLDIQPPNSTREALQENKSQDLVEELLGDAYYGQIWFNIGAIIGAIIVTYLLSILGAGVMLCLIFGALFAIYYSTSIKYTRMNVREAIARDLAKQRLDTDDESAGWINNFLERFWVVFEPELCAQVVAQVDAVLANMKPAFIEELRITTFTLGNKAPRVEAVKTFQRTDSDIVAMDWLVCFIPNDLQDIPATEAAEKVNPKIILTATVPLGKFKLNIPVVMQDFAFRSRMRIKLKLMNAFPHIKTVDVSFLTRPELDYVMKPFGGENSLFDVNYIPGLSAFVDSQVHEILGPLFYAPNVYSLDLDAIMNPDMPIDSARGVLQIMVHSANVKNKELIGKSDPYVKLSLSGKELSRTSVKEDTSNPQWNETKFLLINNINSVLSFDIMDCNFKMKDKLMGTANFDMKVLEEDPTKDDLMLELKHGSKRVGELKVDMIYHPVFIPKKLEDGSMEEAPKSKIGVLRLTIHQAAELKGKGKRNAYAIFKLNGVEQHRTKIFKKSNAPVWEQSFEVFVVDHARANLQIEVMDNVMGRDNTIGNVTITLKELLATLETGQDWFPLTGGDGKLRLGGTWRPVLMDSIMGLGHGFAGPPIGVVKIKCIEARDLKNVEAVTGGKSDPYVRVLSGVQMRGRTDYIPDDLNPVWNESLYVPIHSAREDLRLEAMDYQKLTKHRSLGVTTLEVKDLIEFEETAEGTLYKAGKVIDTWLKLGSLDRKSFKGELHIEASFYPTAEVPDEEAAQAEATATTTAAGEGEKRSEGEGEEEKKADEEKRPENGDKLAQGEAANPKDGHIEPASNQPDNKSEGDEGEKVKKQRIVKKSDILQHQAGVAIISIHEVKLQRRAHAYCEVYVDSNYSQWKTAKIKGDTLHFEETADAFVKELDFSEIRIIVRNHSGDEKDSAVATWEANVKQLIQQAKSVQTETGEWFNFEEGQIRLSLKYIPVLDFVLDPAESIDNQGQLQVTLLNCRNLPAADRGGTSDPYVVFSLNGERLYKSDVAKKTLNPDYQNSIFVAPVPSRIDAKFTADVFDQDVVGKDDFLGSADIDLASIEPFTAATYDYVLLGESGDKVGTIKLRLLFQPERLAPKQRRTGTFSSATRIMTSAPRKTFSGAKHVVKGGAGAVTSGFGLFKHKTKNGSISEVVPDNGAAPNSTTPMPSSMSVQSMEGAVKPASVVSATASLASNAADEDTLTGSPGDLTITVVEAKDLIGADKNGLSDPYVKLYLGSRQIHKTKHQKKTLEPRWNETVRVPNLDGSPAKLRLQVKDHNTFSRSDAIGTADIRVWEHVQMSHPTADVWVPLRNGGNGKVHLKLEFKPAN
ncbi:uncharacterized protein VTP21DRAFT_11654 [Calcarisporiella thermophila]|uniref:uncharacterized protein n=1 Tax=Calcarisporiella thermophila TaxID=911321 RepID=UPI0037441223